MKHPVYRLKTSPAQALGEFIIVTPLLMLLLMGAFFVGLAMYSGSQAAISMKEPILKRMTLAGNAGAVTTGSLGAMVSQSSIGTLPAQLGSTVDQVSLKSANDVMAVMVGKKSFNSGIPFLPVFNFSVTQAIDGNLLKANVATPVSTTWKPPGITPVSPVTYGFSAASLPAEQSLGSVSCASSGTFSVATVNSLVSGAYALTAFSAPQSPPAGAPAFSTTYTGPLYVSNAALTAFTGAPHAACDGSATKFQTECTTASTPAYPLTDSTGNAINVQLVPGATTTSAIFTNPTTGVATTVTLGTDATTGATTFTDPTTGLTVPAPVALTDPTTGVPLELKPDATTGQFGIVDPATGTAVAPPVNTTTATDLAVCAQKKLAACKLQYAAMYIGEQVKALSDNAACTTPDNAAGTQFPAGSTYVY
jgi:hypothetical protein